MADVEVLAEGPEGDLAADEEAREAVEDRAVQEADRLLDPEQALEGEAMAVVELGVGGAGGGGALAALDHRAQLATEQRAEDQRRADALGRGGQAVAGRVADEEDVGFGRGAQAVGDPVAR